MNDPILTATAATYALHGASRSVLGSWRRIDRTDPSERDRGAISLEQVLWFVAAGVSVAVVAAIIWNQIRDQANTPIETPSAP